MNNNDEDNDSNEEMVDYADRQSFQSVNINGSMKSV